MTELFNEGSQIPNEQSSLLRNNSEVQKNKTYDTSTSEDASPLNQNPQSFYFPSLSNFFTTTKEFFSPYKEAVINLSKEGWPVVGAEAVKLIVDAASWTILGWINKETLAATSLMISAVIILRSIMAVFLFYLSRETQTTKNDLGNVLMAGWCLASVLSGISMISGYFSGSIFIAMQQPENVVAIYRQFVPPYIVSLLPTFMGIASQRIDMGMGRAWQVFLFTLLTQPLILALGYPLVFGSGFLPRLGVAGMGYARIISSVLYLALSMASYKFFAVYQERKIFSFSKKAFKESLKNISENGAQMALYAFFELMSAVALILCAGRLGKEKTLAALQLSAQLNSFLANLVYALAIACGITITKLVKNQQYLEARKYAKVTSVMCSLLPAITTAVFLGMGNKFIGLFINEKDEIDINEAWFFCLIALIGQDFDSLRNFSSGMLFAYGDTKSASKSNVATSMLINLPMLLLATFLFKSAVLGATARTLAIAVSAMSLFRVYLRKANAVERASVAKPDEENPNQVASDNNNNNMEVTDQPSYKQIAAPTPGNNRNSFFAKSQSEERSWVWSCAIL